MKVNLKKVKVYADLKKTKCEVLDIQDMLAEFIYTYGGVYRDHSSISPVSLFSFWFNFLGLLIKPFNSDAGFNSSFALFNVSSEPPAASLILLR